MRYISAACIALCTLAFACDDATESVGEGSGAPAASARPTIDLVVRTVEIKKDMTTRPVGGQGDDEKWTAIDGKVYAIVTVDMAHNACKGGDKIETSKAALHTKAGKVQPIGGGPKPDKLCVQCQPTEALDCNNASRLRPYTFIFEVDEKSDVSKAKLAYRDKEAELAVAKVTDSRASDDVKKEIEAKKAELDALKKKLENTSNIANGKVIQSEMKRIEKEIEILKSKGK